MLPQLLQLLDQAFAGLSVARRLLAFWGPVVDTRSLLVPVAAVASVLALALLTGIAVGTLSTLVFILAALYVLLTDVFGVSVDVALA